MHFRKIPLRLNYDSLVFLTIEFYILVSRQVKKPQMPLRSQMNDREDEENQNKFMLVGKVRKIDNIIYILLGL